MGLAAFNRRRRELAAQAAEVEEEAATNENENWRDQDYEDMTKAQLMQLCEERGIEANGKIKKAGLISMLEANE